METEIAKVVKFFAKPGVAAVVMTAGQLKLGDTVHIKGHTTDFTQTVQSMQVDNQDVEEAKPGDMVGFKTSERVREHDIVFAVAEDA